MKRNQGRVVMAAVLAIALATFSATAFADGTGSNPTPGTTSFSEVDGALGFLLDATAAVLNLV